MGQNSLYFDNLLFYFFLYRRSCNIVLFSIQAFRILQQRLTLLICNKQVLFVKDFSVRLSKHFGNHSLYFDNQNSFYFDNLLFYFFLYRRSCNIVLFSIQAFRILQQRLTLLICNKQVIFVKGFSVRLSKHFGNLRKGMVGGLMISNVISNVSK